MDNGNISDCWCENNSITFKLKSISFPLKSMLYSIMILISSNRKEIAISSLLGMHMSKCSKIQEKLIHKLDVQDFLKKPHLCYI